MIEIENYKIQQMECFEMSFVHRIAVKDLFNIDSAFLYFTGWPESQCQLGWVCRDNIAENFVWIYLPLFEFNVKFGNKNSIIR